MLQIFAKKHKGFTLIELLVVIAIIGVLSSVVLVSMGGARKKARDARRQTDMKQVSTSQEMYYTDHEAYVTAPASTGGTEVIPDIGTYLTNIADPKSGSVYVWLPNDVATVDTSCTVGDYFCAYATLEGPTDTTYFLVSENGTKISTTTPVVAANYGVIGAGGHCVCF